jgi:hypothetical protein
VTATGIELAPAALKLLSVALDHSKPEWKKEQESLRRRLQTEVQRAAADHHRYAVSWCQEVHSGPLASPIAVDSPSVELRFSEVPRRLGAGGRELSELDLLVESAHTVLLGELGAGKTTTLRRLAKAVVLEPSFSDEDYWKLALVVVCREESWDSDGLYDVLGRAIGVTGRLYKELDNPDSRIRELLDAGYLILIDGLDEVPPRHRSQLERDIVQLGRHLQRAKIIVSCRSADYVTLLDGFDTAEIQPLGPAEIQLLIAGLLGHDDAEQFYRALQASSASDLAERPLFLIYLAALYKRRGKLPDLPSAVYEGIVRLAIQDWDEQRGVQRTSKWSGFGVDEKRQFLAELALELTRREVARFEEETLVEIYRSLAARYELPNNEALKVVRELESHTGLLVQTGDGYEFGHLGMQEYLAADAAVRGPASSYERWWEGSPAVTAVTVALSTDSNRRLYDLFAAVPANMEDVSPLRVFLDRLGQERPRFVKDAQLGDVLLRLVMRAHLNGPGPLVRLGQIKAVRDSVAEALAGYAGLRVSATEVRAAGPRDQPAETRRPISLPAPLVHTLVGEERLHQIDIESHRAVRS